MSDAERAALLAPDADADEEVGDGRPPAYRDGHDGHDGHDDVGIQLSALSSGTPTATRKGQQKSGSENLLDLLDDADNAYTDLPPASKQEDLHV